MRTPRRIHPHFAVLFSVLVLAACSDAPLAPQQHEDTPQAAVGSRVTLASVTPPSVGCTDGVLPSGALSRICFPADWNGDAVLWGHGYVSPFEPLALPDDEIGGQSVQTIVLALHYAYGTTSFRRNGLVAADAVDDLSQLSQAVRDATGGVVHFIFLAGASGGGHATALAMERAPSYFSGGLIGCAPAGSFRGQVNYFGDVRALFDYFFPGVLPGSAVSIPAALIANWDAIYAPAVQAALITNPSKTAQLIATGGIAVDPSDPTTAVASILEALWYNVFATNNARVQLGNANPYDNRLKWYTGSANDFLLNLRITRYRADAAALAAMGAYETTGLLRRPAQMIHTRYDPVIPFWQAQLYQTKAFFHSGLTLWSTTSEHYGHCAFTTDEVLASFAVLVVRVTLRDLIAPASVFENPESAARFVTLAREGGAAPQVWSAAQISAARSGSR
jgi:hypothetical protein